MSTNFHCRSCRQPQDTSVTTKHSSAPLSPYFLCSRCRPLTAPSVRPLRSLATERPPISPQSSASPALMGCLCRVSVWWKVSSGLVGFQHCCLHNLIIHVKSGLNFIAVHFSKQRLYLCYSPGAFSSAALPLCDTLQRCQSFLRD